MSASQLLVSVVILGIKIASFKIPHTLKRPTPSKGAMPYQYPTSRRAPIARRASWGPRCSRVVVAPVVFAQQIKSGGPFFKALGFRV